MKEKSINLFQVISEHGDSEVVEKLISNDHFRLERIVSRGQVSPAGLWYDQEEHEWVTVLAGKAQIEIQGQEELVTLGPGDTFELPAHMKHRVVWTDPDSETIWLAIFWQSD